MYNETRLNDSTIIRSVIVELLNFCGRFKHICYLNATKNTIHMRENDRDNKDIIITNLTELR